MGSTARRRIHEQLVSCERAWGDFEKDETYLYRGVSRCVGGYPPSETLSDWKRLVRREERSLAETRTR